MNLYFHIPFCSSKCVYCDFLSYTNKEKEDEYFKALLSEIEYRSGELSTRSKVETIYFGGGTPSLVKPENIGLVINFLKKNYNLSNSIEITLEANPENISEVNLKKWQKIGINRLSIGVQTLNNKVRAKMGRRLQSQEVLNKIFLAQQYFDNVGVDLISGLPGDDLETFLLGLDELANLGVKHLSLYDLEIDKDSYLNKHQTKFELLTEEKRRDFLLKSWSRLEELGFEQYEISNFAKNKYYSKHNLSFWEGNDYLGFGLGAVSKVGMKIVNNATDLNHYLKGKYCSKTEKLPKKDTEILFVANIIRLNKSLKPYIKNPETLNKLREAGLIDENCKITMLGRLYNNQLLKDIL